jgi:hypothetical protein
MKLASGNPDTAGFELDSASIARGLRFIAAGIAIFTLAGCAGATMRPISSKPPVAKIVLSAPFSVSAWSGILPPVKYGVILPAGEYHPLYEDDQFYYYQAPSKVVVNDLVSLMFDGGIYVQRGSTAPGGWYYVDQDGSQVSGAFSTPPSVR